MPRDAQPSPHQVIPDYPVRYIVAGTRGYDDYAFFSDAIWETIAHHDEHDILFISGAALSGADAMIIQFCKEFGFPWVEFPADWDTYGKGAGYIRNTAMAKIATHLLTFYDGVSKGTRHMIDAANKRGLTVMTVLIDIKRKDSHGWKSKTSRSSYSRVYREADAW